METNQGFVYAYGWNIYYQKMLGVCAVESEGWLARKRAWIWLIVIFVFIYVPQVSSLPILWGDLNAVIDSLSTNMSILTSLAKIIVFQCKRQVIGSMTLMVADDWAKRRPKIQLQVMLNIATFSRLNSILSFSLTTVLFWAFVCTQAWMAMEEAKNSERDTHLALGYIYPSYFPFDTTIIFYFLPLYIGQFIGTWLSAISLSGTDCYIATIVLHLCGQLQIIRLSLKNLVDDTTLRDSRVYWKRLRVFVERHQRLNEFTREIEETFSSVLLVQMVICSITVCFQGYVMFTTVMDRNGAPLAVPLIVLYVFYAIVTIINFFVYCYVGEKLLYESTQISEDFYNIAWYNLEPKEARAFLFISHRSSSPLVIKAGKFCTFTLRLFTEVMKNSIGYLSMLMAMKDRLIN